MNIRLEAVGKRYQRYWVFHDLSYTFQSGKRYALLGHNGSGKSTLLRIIAGIQSPSTGKLQYDALHSGQHLFRQIAFCAPGMELPEELTLQEALSFHFSFKKPLRGLPIAKIIELTGLSAAAGKPIADYSSGMKQRVKLAQAFFSDTPLLLLDEPCTNLDEAGVAQYLSWINDYTDGRTVIIASNDAREYICCDEQIQMSDYQR